MRLGNILGEARAVPTEEDTSGSASGSESGSRRQPKDALGTGPAAAAQTRLEGAGREAGAPADTEREAGSDSGFGLGSKELGNCEESSE